MTLITSDHSQPSLDNLFQSLSGSSSASLRKRGVQVSELPAWPPGQPEGCKLQTPFKTWQDTDTDTDTDTDVQSDTQTQSSKSVKHTLASFSLATHLIIIAQAT